MSSLTEQQVRAMLELQAAMNAKVDPNWLKSRYPYLRAVVIEGAEAIEHHGWKWWKHQQKDLSQLQMELIDIWHFMLSEMLLETDGDLDHAAVNLLERAAQTNNDVTFDGRFYRVEELDLVTRLELLIGISAARRIEVGLFRAIMSDCLIDWEELFRQYIGKNVLNFFRQDNGYKQGSYRKTWSGREDNEHLVEILADLDADDPAFQENLYQALSQRYGGAAD